MDDWLKVEVEDMEVDLMIETLDEVANPTDHVKEPGEEKPLCAAVLLKSDSC